MASVLLPLIPRGRRSTGTSKTSLGLSSPRSTSSTGDKSSKSKGKPRDRPKENEDNDVAVWLSIFFGNTDPEAPELDHARFNGRVPKEVWEPRTQPYTNHIEKLLFDTKEANRLSAQQSVHLKNPEAKLPIFFAAGKLAVRFSDEILSIQKGACRMCRRREVKCFVFRPLSATKNGYLDLSDFEKMHRILRTIASHTTHFRNRAEVNWAIGDFTSDRPYMCCLAVPVCSLEDHCFREAMLSSQNYIMGVMEGSIKPRPLKEDIKRAKRKMTNTSVGRSFSSTPGAMSPTGWMSPGWMSPTSPGSSFGAYITPPSSFNQQNDLTQKQPKLCTIGTTVFIGRPDLQAHTPPQRGQLTCLVLSSTWPQTLLPVQSKNEADEAFDYCRIAGYHERHILETADYRCAICSDAVPAQSLVHRPIAYIRTGRKELQNKRLRYALMRFAPYVEGRWSCPDTIDFFGGYSDAHVFDFAVPICRSKGICEEVARTAAREFVKLFIPRDMKLAFPGLSPDTDLAMIEFDDDLVYEDNPELLVKKIGPHALISAQGDRGEDPMDCALTVTKLRRWYELCFKEEVAKRAYLKQIGYKRTGDVSDSDSGSDDESVIDDSVIWVYERENRDYNDTESTTNSSRTVKLEDQLSRETVVQRLESQMLFAPALNLDFYLLCEAVGLRDKDKDSEGGSSTIRTEI